MTMSIRPPRLKLLGLAVLLLAALLVAQGCAKKKPDKPSERDAEVTPVPGEKPLPPVPAAKTLSDVEDMVRYVPADTKVVAVLSVPGLTASMNEKGKVGVARLGERMYRGNLVPELTEIDKYAITDVTTIMVATPYAGWPGGTIIVRGKVDEKLFAQQMRECSKKGDAVREVKPESESEKETLVPVFRRRSKLKEVDAFSRKLPFPLSLLLDESETHIAAVDDKTLIITVKPIVPLAWLLVLGGKEKKLTDEPGDERMVRAVETKAKDSKPTLNDKLALILKNADSRDWLTLVSLDDALLPVLKPVLPDVDEVFRNQEHSVTTVREDKETRLTIVSTGKDEDVAKEIESNSRRNVELLKNEVFPYLFSDARRKGVMEELGRSLQVTRKDRTVTLTGALPKEKSSELVIPPKE